MAPIGPLAGKPPYAESAAQKRKKKKKKKKNIVLNLLLKEEKLKCDLQRGILQFRD